MIVGVVFVFECVLGECRCVETLFFCIQGTGRQGRDGYCMVRWCYSECRTCARLVDEATGGLERRGRQEKELK